MEHKNIASGPRSKCAGAQGTSAVHLRLFVCAMQNETKFEKAAQTAFAESEVHEDLRKEPPAVRGQESKGDKKRPALSGTAAQDREHPVEPLAGSPHVFQDARVKLIPDKTCLES